MIDNSPGQAFRGVTLALTAARSSVTVVVDDL
jgi:hypothetical protein